MSGVGCGFCSSEGTVGFVGVVEPWVFVCVCVVGKKWLLSCVCCEDGRNLCGIDRSLSTGAMRLGVCWGNVCVVAYKLCLISALG